MLNKAILVGRLTADPELRTTPNGVSVTTFRIAVNRAYDKDKADFITVVTWRQSAEFVCKYFEKGSAIGIDGSIQTRDYTDKEGNKRTAFEVVADRVTFVERRQEGSGTSYAGSGGGGPKYQPDISTDGDFSIIDGDDDLPFD